MRKAVYILLFYYVSILSGISQELHITNFKVATNGEASWQTENEKANTIFEIREFRWNKYLPLGELKGKGAGNNLYFFICDTACGLYHLRITAKDTAEHHSEKIDYPFPKIVSVIGGLTVSKERPIVHLNSISKYELFDQYGNLLQSGCNNNIHTDKLLKGLYYICFGNDIKELTKH